MARCISRDCQIYIDFELNEINTNKLKLDPLAKWNKKKIKFSS